MRCVTCGGAIETEAHVFESIAYPYNPEWRTITTAASVACSLAHLVEHLQRVAAS